METVYRRFARLRSAAVVALVAVVVTAAGANSRWSNVRSTTFTSIAAQRTGGIELILASSFEMGETQGPGSCTGAGADRDLDGLLDIACVTAFTPPDPVAVAPPL
ncbi:MAG: hypothetical protein ABIP49_10200, partial [Lysobacterales bacterium]